MNNITRQHFVTNFSPDYPRNQFLLIVLFNQLDAATHMYHPASVLFSVRILAKAASSVFQTSSWAEKKLYNVVVVVFSLTLDLC